MMYECIYNLTLTCQKTCILYIYIYCEQLYTRYSGCKILYTLMWMIPIWSQRSCTVWAMQRMSSSVFLARRRCLSELWSLQCPCNRRSWPVALSRMQAEDEEVLHSPIPLILSSHPPHLWLRTDEQMHDFGHAVALNNEWINWLCNAKGIAKATLPMA